MTIKKERIYYLEDKNGQKLLPYQYYNLFNYISLPMEGKKILIPNWQNYKETVAPHYINQNIGLLTGKVNNLTVLDVDVKDDGIKYFKEFMKDHDEILTPTVKSPGGSYHFYFKFNNKIPNMNRLLIDGKRVGIDLKSNGSIIVSVPSIYPGTNKRYRFVSGLSFNDVKPINMPKYLEKFILSHLKERNIKQLKKNKL